MHVVTTKIPVSLDTGAKEFFRDEYSFFMETFNEILFHEITGCDFSFVQDNHSRLIQNVLRGIHYQIRQPQGMLVRVSRGRGYELAVDLCNSFPASGQWVGV